MSEKSVIQVSLLGCFTIGFGVAVGYVCGQEIARAIFSCFHECCTEPSKNKKSLAPKVPADHTDAPDGAGLPVVQENQMPESLNVWRGTKKLRRVQEYNFYENYIVLSNFAFISY